MVFNIINAFTAPLHGCKKDVDCDSRAKCNDGKCICQGNTTGNGKFCRGNSPWTDWVLAFSSIYCNILLSSCTWSPALLSYDWLFPSDSHQTNMAQHCYLNFPRNLNSKALSAPMHLQKCAFSLSSKTNWSIIFIAHTTVWCVFDNPRRWALCACYKHTRLRYLWSSFSFCFVAFSTVYANALCMRFRFDPLSRAFFKSMRFRWKRSAF